MKITIVRVSYQRRFDAPMNVYQADPDSDLFLITSYPKRNAWSRGHEQVFSSEEEAYVALVARRLGV